MIDIEDLSVTYRTKKGLTRAVEGANFTIKEGEVLGVIGESGSGKTTLAEALLRLLPENSDIPSGRIIFNGEDLIDLPDRSFNQLRWEELSYIPQSSMDALDPLSTILTQYRRIINAHPGVVDVEDVEAECRSAFQAVGLDPSRVSDYPHEMSGGMKQRVMIALAFALSPSLIIADEPTTALDVVIQDIVLETLLDLQRDFQTSILLITHDLSVITEVCDRVAVMYAGDVVEIGELAEIFRDPAHPYTMGLKNAVPNVDNLEKKPITIPGSQPKVTERYEKCKFLDRCPFSEEACEHQIDTVSVSSSHRAKCTRTEDRGQLQEDSTMPEVWK